MKRVRRMLAMMLAVVMVVGTQTIIALADEEAGAMEAAAREEPSETAVNAGSGGLKNILENAEQENADAESDMVETYAAGDVVESGSCGENLTYKLTEDGTLTISGSGEMYDVFSGGHTALSGIEDLIKTVIIEEGMTRIGEAAFSDCINLTEVRIPNSVTIITNGAFYGCSSLETIEIPNSVTGFGSYVFGDCSNLKNIKISENMTEISDGTFYGCGNLIKIEIPNKVTTIGNNAFEGCERLVEINIPKGVLGIGHYAFRDCTSLRNIEIPEIVWTIGIGAFENCRSLIEVKLPQKIDEISSYMFTGCNSLRSVEIPGSVEMIGAYAFENCRSLIKIRLPQNVTEIGLYAFVGCDSLMEIKISSLLKNLIRSGAFNNCSALKSIYFEGAAPRFVKDLHTDLEEWFSGVTATVYYPYEYYANGELGWTDDIMQNYGGKLTWRPWNLYIVEEATDRVYVKGSSTGAMIKCTEELGKFISVEVDNVAVGSSYYNVMEGSTILTFLSAYLDTLSVGNHVVTLNYTYGSIDTMLTIIDDKKDITDTENAVTPETPGVTVGEDGTNTPGNVGSLLNSTSNMAQNATMQEVPKTGDNTWAAVWMSATMIAGCGWFALVCTMRGRKRGKRG